MVESNKIAVDLDGTLAKWYGIPIVDYVPTKIGEPIPKMVARINKWLSEGREVVIFTARVHESHKEDAIAARKAIQMYCLNLFGQILDVTCEKDPRMMEIWDDRAISVEKDTGRVTTRGREDDFEPNVNKKMVRNCSRCNGDHEVTFLELRQPCEVWTHWATCPVTGEPILMQLEKEEADALGSFLSE